MNTVTGLQVGSQTPLFEHRSFGEQRPKWIVWLSYNIERTSGTFLILNEDGSILRETVLPEGGTNVVVIKPASFKRGSTSHVK